MGGLPTFVGFVVLFRTVDFRLALKDRSGHLTEGTCGRRKEK